MGRNCRGGSAAVDDHTALINGAAAPVPRGAVCRWVCACFISTFLSLEAMGYQALLPALYRAGMFDFLCGEGEGEGDGGVAGGLYLSWRSPDTATATAAAFAHPHTNTTTTSPSSTEARCAAQQAKLDLLFTLAYVGLNLATLPLAWFMYRYPPKYVSAAALLAKALGYILLALGTDGATTWGGSAHWQYLALFAFPLVASLGLVATLPFLNLPPLLFPAYIGLANASLMGTADASSIWYYAVRQLYLRAGVPLYVMFLAYACFAVIGAGFAWLVLAPLQSARAASQAAHEERVRGRHKTPPTTTATTTSGDAPPLDDASGGEATGADHSVVDVAATEDETWRPLWRRMDWAKFGILCHWHVAFFVMKYFYMTNITSEAAWLTNGDDDRTYALNTAFSIIMPCTGVLTPLVGWLQQRGMRPSIVVNTVCAVLIVVASTVSWYPLQFAMLVCVAASRFLVFSILPTLCGHPRVFGVEGSVVFSISSGIAGGCSMVNYGLTDACRRADSFLAVNIALGGWCLVATAVLMTYLGRLGVQ